MANYRRGRINDAVMQELASILRDVKDPRISGAFISVTGAEVTGDMKYAKIYYSQLSGDKKETAKGLKSASGYIRRELAARLNLRMTPELNFIADGSIEYGARISKVLEGITFHDDPEENADENSDGNSNGNNGEDK